MRTKFNTRYELPPGTYVLQREGDDAGDSGPMLYAVSMDDSGQIKKEGNILEIGKAVLCGSLYARSYQNQDWWMTTPITKFLEVDVERHIYRFRTNNSTYRLYRH